MIFRRKPWNASKWWRLACSFAAPWCPATGGGVAKRTISVMGPRFQAPDQIFRPPFQSSWLKHNCYINSLCVSFGMKGCRYTTDAVSEVPAGGIIDVPLAQTGEGIAECELLKWFVKEGEQVEEFQPLCEVQSDKATIEITSRYKGKVSQILHVPGNVVKVGETLLKIVLDENVPSVQNFEVSEDIEAQESNISDIDSNDSSSRKEKIGRVLSTPVVRNLAKQLGVNVEDIHGTGKDGRVLKEDVLKFASLKGTPKEDLASGASCAELLKADERYTYGLIYEDRTVPLRGYQRAMAKSMTLAAKIPHFYFVEEISCDTLLELKTSFQNENSDPNVKYTFLPLLIKSLSVALNKYPLLNSCFNEELQEVTLKGSHNIGIAMATPNGLVVPNIKGVQSLSITEITTELSRLQQLALSNKLSPGDISGGTITLSNIGSIGGKFGSPIINVPEVSIIAIGRIQQVPHFAEDGAVHPASIMTVNIGADHRILDGATVARFCNEWKLLIEKPELLMLRMR